jgi:RecA-family ATPase
MSDVRTRERDKYWAGAGAPSPSSRRRVAPEVFPPADDEPPPHTVADLDPRNGEREIAPPIPAGAPLSFSDPAAWEGREIPPREWLVHDWIPAAAVTLLSGDGAIGKTTLALQLAVAVKLGLPDWVGGLVDRPGPVIFFSAEEEEAEIWRRIEAIRAARGIKFSDLSGLHVFCMPDSDCAFAMPDAHGSMQTTPLWRGLAAAISNIRPVLVVLEAAADLFGGNEISRRQVSQFIRILRGPAVATRTAVLLLAHPSASGRNSGTGEAGSTQWHNSVRSRLYLTAPKGDSDTRDQDAPDSDVRELRFMKSNYGPKGRAVRLRWERGVYVPVGGGSSLKRIEAEAMVDEIFLRCLDTRTAQGIEVGPNTGRNYAPAVFEGMPEAAGIKRKAFAASQERLLSLGQIKAVKIGPPSRSRSVLTRTSV